MAYPVNKCPTDRCAAITPVVPAVELFPAECGGITTTTTTTTTTTVTSSTNTATTVTSSTPYNCENDPACRSCNADGTCGECKLNKYLLDGVCVDDATECEIAGRHAIGTTKIGRYCLKTNEACVSANGCKIPEATAGSDCEIGILVPNADSEAVVRCAKCADHKFMVNPGRCIGSRKCAPALLPDTTEKFHFFTDRLSGGADLSLEDMCSCASTTVNENGFPILDEEGRSEVSDNCKKCNVRKVVRFTSDGQPTWEYIINQGVQCTRCKDSFYYNPTTGSCVAEEVAIIKAKDMGFVAYGVHKKKSEIEPAFNCINGFKSTTGKKCACPKEMRKNNEVGCEFTISADGFTEIGIAGCENGKYLEGNACVDKCSAGLTHYSTRTSYRSCEKEFTCTDGFPMVKGRECMCPHKDTASCFWFANNMAPEHTGSDLDNSMLKSAKAQNTVSKIVACKSTKLVATKHTVSLDSVEQICVLPSMCYNAKPKVSEIDCE
jgi:hypothetical protein